MITLQKGGRQTIQLQKPQLTESVTPAILTQTSPYLTKQSPDANRLSLEVVGGSVAWNQLLKELSATNWTNTTGVTATFGNGEVSLTGISSTWQGVLPRDYTDIIAGHKYLITVDVKLLEEGSIILGTSFGGQGANIGTAVTSTEYVNRSVIISAASNESRRINIQNRVGVYDYALKNAMLTDLTQMFGTTIADYVYSLEQATAGSGIAWLQSYGWFTEDYYPYNAGELLSVKTSGHQSVSLTLLSDIELRGMPKLVNNQLQYDGDSYEPSGQVTRRYGKVTLDGSESWIKSSSYPGGYYIAGWTNNNNSPIGSPEHIQDKMMTVTNIADYGAQTNVCFFDGSLNIKIDNSLYPTVDAFKAYLQANPVTVVYLYKTTTSETTTPFSDPIAIGSTESFIDERDVPMPVGNVSEYKNAVYKQVIQLQKGIEP